MLSSSSSLGKTSREKPLRCGVRLERFVNDNMEEEEEEEFVAVAAVFGDSFSSFPRFLPAAEKSAL